MVDSEVDQRKTDSSQPISKFIYNNITVLFWARDLMVLHSLPNVLSCLKIRVKRNILPWNWGRICLRNTGKYTTSHLRNPQFQNIISKLSVYSN